MSIRNPDGSTGRSATKRAIANKHGLKMSQVSYDDDKGMLEDMLSRGAIYHRETESAWLIPNLSGEKLISFNPPLIKTDKREINLTQFNVLRDNLHQRPQYDFSTGFTLQNGLETVFFEGVEYRWAGEFPKIVPMNSTPGNAGGIGYSGWISRKWQLYLKTISEQSKRIEPSYSHSDIQSILNGGGDIYVSEGNYPVNQTYYYAENTKLIHSPKALWYANANVLTLFKADPDILGSGYVRNLNIHGKRINLNGKNGIVGVDLIKCRNGSGFFGFWMDMDFGSNSIGMRVGLLCYGLNNENPEILNGGAGSTRLIYQNGANACKILNPKLMSANPKGVVPDYGLIIRNGLNGVDVDNETTFNTTAIAVDGGFIQNCDRYGLMDHGSIGTELMGNTYYEACKVADVNLSSSKGTVLKSTHHSSVTGAVCIRARDTIGCHVKDVNLRGERTKGFYDIDSSNSGIIIEHKRDGLTALIGDVSGAKVEGLESEIRTIQSTDPIPIRSGYSVFYIPMTGNSANLTTQGMAYDGQKIEIKIRARNLTSLTFLGQEIPIEGLGSEYKVCTIEARYMKLFGKWALSFGGWHTM